MTFPEFFSVALVVAVCVALMAGYPVAFTLGGVSLAFALLGHLLGLFDLSFLGAFPQRVFGVMTNDVLLAIPLFIFMGVMLERSRIAEDLLETMGRLFGPLRGGLGISVVIVGVLLAAAKGVVGATVVTMGLIVLPAMLRFGYDKRLAAGTVAATATLAQIFPPATVLVLLGDQLSNAYQSAQLAKGIFAPKTVSVSDLFAGAIVPGFALVLLYLAYLVAMAIFFPKSSPAMPADPKAPRGFAMAKRLIEVLIAPLLLILAVLGSILGGVATPTEAASIGAVGAILLSARKTKLSEIIGPAVTKTAQITTMIFVILIGATLFSLVFRGLGRLRDHLRRGADRRAGAARDARHRSGLARCHDGGEPADLLHASAARPDIVLPARRGAAGSHDRAHIHWHHSLRRDPAVLPCGIVVLAGARDGPSARPLWRLTSRLRKDL
jgi:tripartite ATP-independent transporter DctM subunit